VVFQRTIKREVSLEGIGIHTGSKIKTVLKPAPAGSGIKFRRTDIATKPVISAVLSNLADLSKRPRRTSLCVDGLEIHTVEHLLASLCGLGIDNIMVEVSGPELPGLDGSAEGFVRVLKEAGICEQDTERKNFYIKEPLWVKEDDSMLIVLPDINFKISYTLDYPTTSIKTQYRSFIIEQEMFEREIAPCRTFCLKEEVEHLLSLGLGKGASFDNTLVLGEDGIISGRLRFEDELLRHKVLDLIGDFYLLGVPIKGHVICVKSGHALNIELLQKIGAQREKFKGLFCEPEKETPFVGKGVLDSEQIQKIIPHRYPFLMIDKILELSENSALGLKVLSKDDYFFAGHFPGKPIMPGVLILEALAQVGGVLMLSRSENRGKIAYFMSINNVKFRRIVKPGDELILKIEVVRCKTKTGQIRGTAFVGEKLAAEADLMFALGDGDGQTS
jgi:UDP-3-O-[3-hydroxymyristoyl] N-acetylglucosamine deacetylase/3-hydroxyacyl-[acyl-carrier-protein] dehydratase